MIAVGVSDLVLGTWWPAVFPDAALAPAVFSLSTAGEAVGKLVGPVAS